MIKTLFIYFKHPVLCCHVFLSVRLSIDCLPLYLFFRCLHISSPRQAILHYVAHWDCILLSLHLHQFLFFSFLSFVAVVVQRGSHSLPWHRFGLAGFVTDRTLKTSSRQAHRPPVCARHSSSLSQGWDGQKAHNIRSCSAHNVWLSGTISISCPLSHTLLSGFFNRSFEKVWTEIMFHCRR